MESLNHQKKSLVLILLKQTQSFVWKYYNADNSYFIVNGKEIFKLKANKQ